MPFSWWRRRTRRASEPTKDPRLRARSRPAVEQLEDRWLPSADTVLEWNAVALQAVVVDHTLPGGTQTGPTRTSRALAIESAAVYDAVNSIDGSYTPYLTQAPGTQGASIDAAAAEAAHDTLVALYPLQAAAFDAALQQTLARVPDGPAETRGIAVGRLVARNILAARSNDGSAANPPYTPGTQPGQWQPDPTHPGQQALTPGWGDVTPFALASGSQFQAPPPALGSPEYAQAFNEVKALGGDGTTTPTQRTPEQTLIGLFWAYDGSPGVGTPPRLYNQIIRTIAIQENNTPVENARLFALVNLSMADAGITAWDTKYTDNFWRPVTAIRDAAADGNPSTTADRRWTPLGAPADNGSGTNFTPPFPAYTSGHATFGAAAFGALRDFYGTDNITFTIGSDEFNGVTRDQNGKVRLPVFRTFTSFSQAAEENAQSRIYLGIHWSFDKVQGINQGNEVADYVFANFLRPTHGGKGGGGRGAHGGAGGGHHAVDGVAAARALVAPTGARLDGSPPGARLGHQGRFGPDVGR